MNQTRLILFLFLLMLFMPVVLSQGWGATGIMLEGGILMILLFLFPWLWGMIWKKLVALSDERGPSTWAQRSRPAITRMRWIGTFVAISMFIILISDKIHGIWLIILVCAEALFVLVEIALLLALKIGESPLRFLPTLVRAFWARPLRPHIPKPSYLAQIFEASEAVPHDGNQQNPFQEAQGLPYDELQRYEQGYQPQDLPARNTPSSFSTTPLHSARSQQHRQTHWGE